MLVAKHNLLFRVADHITKLALKMFPDSAIAKSYGSEKTKTMSMVRGQDLALYFNSLNANYRQNVTDHICYLEALGPDSLQKAADLCKGQKFGLLIDETTD